jgi:hypothetical protein
MKIVTKKIGDLIEAEYNPRQLTKEQFQQITDSIKRFGIVDPIIVNKNKQRKNIIVGGHQRVKVAGSLGFKEIPCVEVDLTPDKERELNVRLNKNTGEWDWDELANHFDVSELIDWGFNDKDLAFFDLDGMTDDNIHNKLTDNFLVPPFSILDTRQEYWQDRKREWKSLIGDNGESRENTLMGDSQKGLSDIKDGIGVNYFNSASILDPVLAELSNLWFGVNKGKSFDCFAGDSVFGYVSDYLGNKFTGIELRQEQTDLNNKRLKGTESKYICDDGQNVLKHIKANTQDLLFSCPPYFDLEVYSTLENDASNQKEYKDFIKILDKAFSDSIKCLKNNRFAVITISNIRNKKGFYYNLVDDVKNIFIKNNMPLYNDIILIEQSGTAAIRASRNMKNRKVCKTHQNILVFYKGDTKEIKNIYPKLDLITDESQDV